MLRVSYIIYSDRDGVSFPTLTSKSQTNSNSYQTMGQTERLAQISCHILKEVDKNQALIQNPSDFSDLRLKHLWIIKKIKIVFLKKFNINYIFLINKPLVKCFF